MRNIFVSFIIFTFCLGFQLKAQDEDMHYSMKCIKKAEKCPCKKAHKNSKKKLSANSKDKKKRAKALALRKAQKENQKLKDELEALRRANLIAAAKQTEKPITAKLAETTETTAPLSIVTKEEVASAVAETNPNPFFAKVTNSISKDFVASAEQPLSNTLSAELGYRPIPKLEISAKPQVGWNWSNPANTTNSSSFEFKNIPIKVKHKEIIKFENINSFIYGSLVAVLPTNATDRNNGLITQFQANMTFHTDFGNNKTDIEFTPGMAFDVRQATTSAPTTNIADIPSERTYTHTDGAKFEMLTPNTQYTVSFLVELEHKFVDMLEGSLYTKFNFNKKYSDTILYNGSSLTLTPDLWESKIEIGAYSTINFTKEFSGEIGASSSGLIAGYRPFSTQDKNSVSAWFGLKYKFN